MSLFFFQAEDGIRDLVRSRGLGDVYKRQLNLFFVASIGICEAQDLKLELVRTFNGHSHGVRPVSYTHLTLPTSDLV